jgi:hypothetical protein
MNTHAPASSLLLTTIATVIGNSLCAQTVINPTNPEPIVTYSPDVLPYGAPSGLLPDPRSRVQVFGFPRPGVTIELQVVGARPNVAATFVVSNGWADQQVPGFGRVLVDTTGATTITTTTGMDGSAVVPLTLPASAQVGDDWFVQCNTVDSGGSPVWELSSAAAFEVGNSTKPIGMTSHLAGTITVAGGGGAVTSPNVSGVLSREWNPRSGGVSGFVAVHTVTDVVQVNGVTIHDLHVHPGVTDAGIAWTGGTFLTVPAASPDQFFVGFTVSGVEFGPYAVPGTLGVSLGDVAVSLGPIPALDSNPLAGAVIQLDLDETFVGTEYFQHLDSLGLPASLAAGYAVTGTEVEATFLAHATALEEALAAHLGNRACFTLTIPAYATFLAREAAVLTTVTGGLASTNVQVHELVRAGTLTEDEGLGSVVFAKFCALLDIADDIDGLKEVFDELCGDLNKQLQKQVKAGKYKAAAKTAGKILDKMASEKFAKKLADKVGSSVAKKILKKVCAGCVPFFGWAYLVGGMIWTLIEQLLEE